MACRAGVTEVRTAELEGAMVLALLAAEVTRVIPDDSTRAGPPPLRG